MKKAIILLCFFILVVVLLIIPFSKAKELNFSDEKNQNPLPVIVQDGTRENFCLSRFLEPRKILEDCGAKVYKEDKVKAFPSPSLGIGTKIEIKRATPVYFKDGGKKEKTVRTWTDTIKEFLKKEDIQLGKKDKIKPSLDKDIERFLEIKITRIGTRVEKKEVSVPYSTKKLPDDDLLVGKSYVGQKGENGVKINTYKVRVKNNKEVNRRLISSKVKESAEDRIIYYGTKPPIVSTKYGSLNYSYMGTCSTYYSTGDKLRITNQRNGKSATVIVDCGGPNCGPFDGPMIDLEISAFRQIESLWRGIVDNAKIEELAY